MSSKAQIQEQFERVVEEFNRLEEMLRMTLPRHTYDRLKSYGLNYVSAGLGEGDALPCMYPINAEIEALNEEDPDVDDD